MTAELEDWRRRLERGGATLGIALGMLQSVGNATASAGLELGGFAPAFEHTDHSSLTGALRELLEERNRVQGDRPRSDRDYEGRVANALPAVERALEASSFLVRGRFLWIDDVRPVESTDGPAFELKAESAMGPHPEWDIVNFEVGDLVFDRRFYLSIYLTPSLVPPCHT